MKNRAKFVKESLEERNSLKQYNIRQRKLNENYNKVVDEISDLAVEKVEKWIRVDPDEFFEEDFENQRELVSSDIDAFFEKYGEDLDDQYGEEVISDNYSDIIDAIVKKLN